MEDDKLIEKKVSSELIYNGKLLHVFSDVVSLPNSNKAKREWINHPGASAIAALTDKNELILVRQYRYPVGRITLEIPAGKLNFKGEDPLECAKRELSEETGYEAKKYEKILTTATTVAFSNEYIHIFLATELSKGKMHPDDDEFIDCLKIPLSKAEELVYNGEIIDAKTIIAILYLAKKIQNNYL